MPTSPQPDRRQTPPQNEALLVVDALLLVGWMGCLLWGSLATSLPRTPLFQLWDKLQHFFAYAVLMFFAGRFFERLLRRDLSGWLTGFAVSVFFGLSLEFLQGALTRVRHFDLFDLAANTLGAATTFLIVQIFKKRSVFCRSRRDGHGHRP